MDPQSEIPRKPGTFMPGHDSRRVIPTERKPKSPNLITRDLKRGIMGAAERHGSDGNGEGGLEGYCYFLASKHPKCFSQLLGRILPMQLNTSGSGNFIASVNIVSIPSDSYLAPEDIARIKAQSNALEHDPGSIESLPDTLEHVASDKPSQEI